MMIASQARRFMSEQMVTISAGIILLLAFLSGVQARPVRGSQPISVLLCNTSDSGEVPWPYTSNSYYKSIIAELQSYWKAVSYNLYNNKGSVVRPWTTMPFNKAQEVCPPRCVSSSQCNSKCEVSKTWPSCHACQRWARVEDCINAHKNSPAAPYTIPAGHLTIVATYPALDYWGAYGWGAYLTYNGLSITGLAHELGHAIGLEHSFSNDPNYQNADWASIGEYDDMWDLMSAFHAYTTDTVIRPPGQIHEVQTGPSLAAYHMERMGWIPWPYLYTMGAQGETTAEVIIRAKNTFEPPDPTMLLPLMGTKNALRPATYLGRPDHTAAATAQLSAEEEGYLGSFANAVWPEQVKSTEQTATSCYQSLLDSSLSFCGEFTYPHLAQLNNTTGRTFRRHRANPIRGSRGSSRPVSAVAAAVANQPPERGDYYLMIRIPIDPLDYNHYLTVEYTRNVGVDEGIPKDKQILIHEVKAVDAGVYRLFLLRDLNNPSKPPATVWNYTNSDGTMVTISTTPGVNGNDDFATASITSTFARRCQMQYVWREACTNDYTCVSPAERTANRNANANPRYSSRQRRCSSGLFPRMACGLEDRFVCVDKAAKYQIALANNAAASRFDNKATSVYGPNTCKPGFVWRGADMFDYICVDIAARSAAAADNLERWNRFDPAATDASPYGIFTCQQGYVWREAYPGDKTCTSAAIRRQAAEDNSKAHQRLVNAQA